MYKPDRPPKIVSKTGKPFVEKKLNLFHTFQFITNKIHT